MLLAVLVKSVSEFYFYEFDSLLSSQGTIPFSQNAWSGGYIAGTTIGNRVHGASARGCPFDDRIGEREFGAYTSEEYT